ncbi:MAG TPA: hypothetical protein PL180_04375 [Spirochaetota bacterium]|nr:hypothetical protein [Spirochaetota bacterium]
MAKIVKVTKQSSTGLNLRFLDTKKHKTMSRGEFADAIERGVYPDYHVKHIKIGDVEMRIPASNPDKSENNNLG